MLSDGVRPTDTNMSLPPASSSVLDVYQHHQSYAALLSSRSDLAVVARLRGAVRKWKSRRRLATLEAAYLSYRDHLLTIPLAKSEPVVEPANVVIPESVLDCNPVVNFSVPASSSFEQLTRDVALLRGMLSQQRTPIPLQTKLIDRRHRSHLQVLSIVGDGRCLFYSLLQSQCAMLPTADEADELRARLRVRLLESYTDEQWERRVPEHMRDFATRQQFLDRYLTRPTAHVPLDAIALWQDSHPVTVYVLNRTAYGETVHRLHAADALHAVIFILTWYGVGHYEVVTYNNILTLPSAHELCQHLDVLYCKHVMSLRVETRRTTKRRKRSAAVADIEID